MKGCVKVCMCEKECVCVKEYVRVCVTVYVRERAREKEWDRVFVTVCE